MPGAFSLEYYKRGNDMKSCNIIDSVKGGSGKTSLALILTAISNYEFQKPDAVDKNSNTKEEELRTRKAPAILMDMDMQGSALKYLLFGKETPGSGGLAPHYLNERILDYYRTDSSSMEYISTPILCFSADNVNFTPVKLSAALASPVTEDRNKFRAQSRTNYTSAITYQNFRMGFRETVERLDKVIPGGASDVFFDMPPNSNGFSDAVLEFFLGKEAYGRKHRCTCNYFELMTLDRGHIGASLDWFKSFVKEEQYVFPDHFFFVIDNVPPSISSMDINEKGEGNAILLMDNSIKELKKNVRDILHNSRLENKKIYFLGIKYLAEYLLTCCRSEAIGNNSTLGEKNRFIAETSLVPISSIEAMEPNDLSKDVCELIKNGKVTPALMTILRER